MKIRARQGVALVAFVVLVACQSVPPGRVASSPQSDFPHVISFQPKDQFEAGDNITITEIRGTSSDLRRGLYRISGKYTLASHDSATLAASVTARSAADGVGPWNPAQRMDITKGQGTFTLLLPISIDGSPHISFYDSNSFGGCYIASLDPGVSR